MGFNRGRWRTGAAGSARRTRVAQAGTAVTLCGLMAVAGGARAQADATAAATTAPAGKTVSLRLSNADIYTVINQFQDQTKMDVAIIEGAQPYNKLNVFLNKVTPEAALRYIAASAGAIMTRNSDGVYIIQPSVGQPETGTAPAAPQSPSNQSPAPDAPSLPQYKPGDFRPHKLFLRYVSPDAVLKKLHWADPSDDPGPSNSDIERDLSRKGSDYSSLGSGVNVMPQSGNMGQTSPYQQPTVPAGRGNTGLDQANDAVSAGRSVDPSANVQAQQFPGFGGGFGGGQGGFGGGGFGGGQGGFGGGGFGGGQGGFGGGGFGGGQRGGIGGIGGRGQQQSVLPDGVDRLYAIEGDNSLLVFSTVDGFNLVKEIVKNLDIAPRQVSIKVEFVTASVSDIDNFGINFSLIPVPSVQANFTPALPSTAGGSGANTTPNSYIQFQYGNVAAQLFALLQNSRSKLVSAPIISTTNNVPAYINFTQTIPFQTQNTTIVPNGGTVTTTQQNIQYINTYLPVIPRINGDDTVTLDLQPTISAPIGTPQNGQPAPTSTQNLQTTRTVRSGETMVLGGLVSKTEAYAQSKIPLLGDLPILGSFFRSRTKNNSDSELLIFVTPTIIDENSTNSGITAVGQGDVGVNAAPGDQANPGGQVAP